MPERHPYRVGRVIALSPLGPGDGVDRPAHADRDEPGGRRALRAAESLGGGEPGAAVAQATDVTGGGGAAESTTCGVPRRGGQRGAADAKRRMRRAGGARPAPPGVERLERKRITPPPLGRSPATRSDRRRELVEMNRGHFQVSSERKRATRAHLKVSAGQVQLSSS
jgi:hypothetical protein